jgi:predicted deacylase
MRFESIGTSNGGLDIPIIKITNKPKRDYAEEKPVIFIIARQHSGETHSSFILHGFMNFIVSREALCEKLRDRYEFWIVPMANPDGVVCGNYRCNTQGKDMNRFFFADDDPEAKLRLTEVELIRTYLKEKLPKGEDKFKMFLDIHAHSAQTSIFVFCPQVEDPEQQEMIKRFPMILDNTSAYFLFDNCKFGNEKYKANCARLGIHRDFKLVNSFTIEASCYAYDIKGTDEVEQFKEDHFLKFGEQLVHSIA